MNYGSTRQACNICRCLQGGLRGTASVSDGTVCHGLDPPVDKSGSAPFSGHEPPQLECAVACQLRAKLMCLVEQNDIVGTETTM